MTLQPATIAAQDDFDVTFKVYAGPAYKDIDLADYPLGVEVASAVLATWTDVTEYVIYNGMLTIERVSSTIRFAATLNGVNYNADYFGPGQAVLCLNNIKVSGVQTVPADTGTTWATFFVGHVMEGNHEDDYKHGGRWSRQLGGLDSLLQRSTAPRLAAGRVNLLSNSAVEASSTLVTPALEAGTGEFAGSIVNVDPENTIDGNINTLWMSNDVPHSTALSPTYGTIRKLFINPITGFDQSRSWWFEFNSGAIVNQIRIRNSDGVTLGIDPIANGTYIVCADRAYFEAYVGETNVDRIFDVRDLPRGPGYMTENAGWQYTPIGGAPFSLSATEGWIQFWDDWDQDAVIGAVAWDQVGAVPSFAGYWAQWEGPAINVSAATPGYGLLHDVADAASDAAEWTLSKYIFPGDSKEPENIEWLLYTLESQNSALTKNAVAGDTSIEVSSTIGLLDSGTAICEADTFTYTGRTGTTLTGIPASGANAIGNHSLGAGINQVIDSVTQTGWPCSSLELLRPVNPDLEYFLYGKVYFAKTGLVKPRTPDPEAEEGHEDDWQQDYDTHAPAFSWVNSEHDFIRDHGFPLMSPDGEPRWVQYMLVVFIDMSNDSRARINEVRLNLAQTQVDSSGLGDIDTLSSKGLAQYLLTLAGVTLILYEDVEGMTGRASHLIGEHATAIMPYTRILDDLARITGCVMYWGQASVISWRHDMWWPVGFESDQFTPTAILDSTSLQGSVQYAGRIPDEGGVRIHARTPNGLRQYDATFPPNVDASVQLIELDDLVATTVNAVIQLAETMYYKNGLNYSHGAQEIIFNVKGPGNWLYPEQYVQIPTVVETGKTIALTDYGQVSGETHTMTSWLIESVTWEWGLNDNNARTWKVTARGRRYWR